MQRKGGKGESVCAICDGAVPRKTSLSTLIAPCCSAFLHKDCIQVGFLSGVFMRLVSLGASTWRQWEEMSQLWR